MKVSKKSTMEEFINTFIIILDEGNIKKDVKKELVTSVKNRLKDQLDILNLIRKIWTKNISL